MPRDVLLVLVLIAVLLNLVLLLGVGIGRWRAMQAPARPGRKAGHAVSGIPPSPIHQAVVQRQRPAPWSEAGVRAIPGFAARQRTRPIDPQLLQLATTIVEAGDNGLRPAATAKPTDIPSPPTRPSIPAAPPAEPEPVAAGPDQPPPKQETGNRRGRRFVLPPTDEDRGRTERAIEAFLGEPAPSGSTSAHRPRRRARRHKTPGEAQPPIVLVAALGGFDELRSTVGREGAVRFAEAYGEALRATLRSGDHVTDLGQGRLRLVVHADEDGARALMDRARAVCQPWLRLAPVPLSLRVRPMPENRPTDGRRGDGRTNGSAPAAALEARSGGRPDDGASRRLAAG